MFLFRNSIKYILLIIYLFILKGYFTCKTCSGPSNENCLSCLKGNYFDNITKSCNYRCPLKFYKDDDSNWCLGCSDNCLEC
jgi:proprotein convertase subtilisin/kexin type 5